MLSNLKSIQQQAFRVGGDSQGTAFVTRSKFLFRHETLAITELNANRTSIPTPASFLDWSSLIISRVINSNLRPNHCVTNNTVAISHDVLRHDLAGVIVNRNGVLSSRTQSSRAHNKRFARLRRLRWMSLFSDKSQGGTDDSKTITRDTYVELFVLTRIPTNGIL